MLFYEQVSLRTCITDSKLSPTHVILFHLFPIYSCSLLEISLPIISESTAKFWIKPESVTSNARLTPFSLFVLEHFFCLFLEKRLSSYVIKLLEFIIPITPENEKNGTDMCEPVFFGHRGWGWELGISEVWIQALSIFPQYFRTGFPWLWWELKLCSALYTDI